MVARLREEVSPLQNLAIFLGAAGTLHDNSFLVLLCTLRLAGTLALPVVVTALVVEEVFQEFGGGFD